MLFRFVFAFQHSLRVLNAVNDQFEFDRNSSAFQHHGRILLVLVTPPLIKHNRRAAIVRSRPSAHSCLADVKGQGHTLVIEGSMVFCDVLSLRVTDGLLSLSCGKEGGIPPPSYAWGGVLSSG